MVAEAIHRTVSGIKVLYSKSPAYARCCFTAMRYRIALLDQLFQRPSKPDIRKNRVLDRKGGPDGLKLCPLEIPTIRRYEGVIDGYRVCRSRPFEQGDPLCPSCTAPRMRE